MSSILASLKAIAALVGSAATAALGILPPDQYKWLAVVCAVCTAVATYAVPNIPADVSKPSGRHVAP
ncbi:MAG: hypothetical protein ACTHJ9_06330 [Rhodanobacter sp.]